MLKRLMFGFLFLVLSFRAQGSLYWESGTRSKFVTVCFVSDGAEKRPNRVTEIFNYLRDFEAAANVRFSNSGKCAAPTKQSNGQDYHGSDIRVLIPGTTATDALFNMVQVPGQGCTSTNDPKNFGGSWSNPPSDLEIRRNCLYNLKLADDGDASGTYRNHTLHEFGHALGLGHEHERSDANIKGCLDRKALNLKGYEGYALGVAELFLTAYDRLSVMHYQYDCGSDGMVNGNYGHNGLSEGDKFAVHVLYPEDNRVAEYIGTTVVTTAQSPRFYSAWKARGGVINNVAKSFSWSAFPVTLGLAPDMTFQPLSAGTYSVDYSYSDFLNRDYKARISLRVLTPQDFTKRITGPVAALGALF